MAAQSKRATALAKAKRLTTRTKSENTELRALGQAAIEAQGRATAIVLALLVQAGGDVTISQATTDQMSRDIVRMGYKIQPTPEGLVQIVLVMQDAAAAPSTPTEEAPSGQIILTD